MQLWTKQLLKKKTIGEGRVDKETKVTKDSAKEQIADDILASNADDQQMQESTVIPHTNVPSAKTLIFELSNIPSSSFIVHVLGVRDSAMQPGAQISEVVLKGLFNQLEAEIEKATALTKFVGHWHCTFTEQAEAVNKAYSKLQVLRGDQGRCSGVGKLNFWRASIKDRTSSHHYENIYQHS